MFWNVNAKQNDALWEKCVAGFLLISPTLFYVGMLDRVFAHVLYSGMIPQGVITLVRGDEESASAVTMEIRGWGPLAVPFPRERRLLKQHFELVAPIGSKLHIADPRLWLDDLYFRQTDQGAIKISKREFFSAEGDAIRGVGHDDRQANFVFDQAGVRRLARSATSAVYAIEFTSENFDRNLLKYLTGFPNVEQLQFAGCELVDDDLKYLPSLLRLSGIGLRNTRITDAGLRHLEDLPELKLLEVEGTAITQDGLEKTLSKIR